MSRRRHDGRRRPGPPDQDSRYLAIDMLVAGGKTSTVTQFTELARRAGLEVVAAGPQPSGRFVVECRTLS